MKEFQAQLKMEDDMAVVLDINILCSKMLDLNKSASLLAKHNISIGAINSIDNWMWDNEKEVEDFKQIANILDSHHIVTIKLKQPSIKDMGVYIEKVENQFLYTLWINTEGYAMLDCEKLTVNNSEFYKKLIQAVLEMNRLIEDSFEVVGIGLETDFYYEKNVMDIIRKSTNMLIWILNVHDGLNIQLDRFKGNVIEDVYVFTRE